MFAKKFIKSLPTSSGVYLMRDKRGEIIYIGKADNLKKRVLSYFRPPQETKTMKLLDEVSRLEIKKTRSEIETLLLEAELVKKYQPKFNVKLKDDRSFVYLGETKDDFPAFVFIRGRELKLRKKEFKEIFGPFSSTSLIKQAYNFIREIFPFRSCRVYPKSPCLFYHLHLCSGPCFKQIEKNNYQYFIEQVASFLKGKSKKIIDKLKSKMKSAALRQDFEKAKILRDKIFALENIDKTISRKKIDLDSRIEGYDVSDIAGHEAVGSMVVFEARKPFKKEYRKFKIKRVRGINDCAMLGEIIERRMKHLEGRDGWPLPELIIIDGGRGQVNAAMDVLKREKVKIPVLGIAKGEKRKKNQFVFGQKENKKELEELVKNNFKLFCQVRNEAHRFALSFHRQRRREQLLKD